MNYDKYLKSSHWKSKREETMRSRGEVCEICLSSEMINIHHSGYTDKEGKSVLNNESIKYLFVLCSRCHGLWHKYHKLDRLTPRTKRWAIRIYKLTKDIDMTMRFCSDKVARKIILQEYTQGKERKFKSKYMCALRNIYRSKGGINSLNGIYDTRKMESMILKETDTKVIDLVNIKKELEIKCDYFSN